MTEKNHLALPFVPWKIDENDYVLVAEEDSNKEKMRKIKLYIICAILK